MDLFMVTFSNISSRSRNV